VFLASTDLPQANPNMYWAVWQHRGSLCTGRPIWVMIWCWSWFSGST